MTAGDLTCRGLRKAFAGGAGNGRAVLDGIDLDVRSGDTLVLLGSSGAGKTTLLRILAGLEVADAGRVVLGERVLSDPQIREAPERRGIGMVFQALELWPHMSVAEHLAFGMPGRRRGQSALADPMVRHLAAQVGLAPELLARRPDTLSGGEQQRVAIARALGAEPDVLLYDEPLANLDPGRRRSLRALIRKVAREGGTTLVYVTHDPDEAMEIGDEIAVLAAGRLVERGAPQALYRSPRTLDGARALGPVTALPCTVLAGHMHTALGVLEPVDATRLTEADQGGACLALLRPEHVGLGNGEGVEATVDDVVTRARDWAFRADLDGTPVLGRCRRPVEAGSRVRLRAEGPAAAVPDPEQGGEP